MAYTQAEELIYFIESNKRYWNHGRGLECDEVSPETNRANILYNNNNVGYAISDSEFSEYTFIALTLDTKFLPRRVAQKIVNEANECNMRVVFVPEIDIGFGLDVRPLSISQIKRNLERVAKYSQDDIKTAVVATDITTAPIAYTFNQLVNEYDEIVVCHAEDTLVEFIKLDEQEDVVKWYMLLEPCHHCLTKMVETGARYISYFELHKDKWNTPEYLQLVNDIHSKEVRPNGRPIIYKKESAV